MQTIRVRCVAIPSHMTGFRLEYIHCEHWKLHSLLSVSACHTSRLCARLAPIRQLNSGGSCSPYMPFPPLNHTDTTDTHAIRQRDCNCFTILAPWSGAHMKYWCVSANDAINHGVLLLLSTRRTDDRIFLRYRSLGVGGGGMVQRAFAPYILLGVCWG